MCISVSFYRKWPHGETTTSQRQPRHWASTSANKRWLLWRHQWWRGAWDSLLVWERHECPKYTHGMFCFKGSYQWSHWPQVLNKPPMLWISIRGDYTANVRGYICVVCLSMMLRGHYALGKRGLLKATGWLKG